MAVWGALMSAALLCEVVGLLAPGWPTIGDFVRLVMRPRIGRWIVLIGWMWLGWHTLVR